MILSSLKKLKQKGVKCHQYQILSCQMKRYAMLGWQLSYFTNVCTVQLEVSFTPLGDRTSKLQQELMLQYNSSLRY